MREVVEKVVYDEEGKCMEGGPARKMMEERKMDCERYEWG